MSDAKRCRRLVIANADGTDAERARVGCAWGGSWSPNSRRLLVERYSDRAANVDMWDMTIDGFRKRFVTVGKNASWRPRPDQTVERGAFR